VTWKQVLIPKVRIGMRKLRMMVLIVIALSPNQTLNKTLKGFTFGTLSIV